MTVRPAHHSLSTAAGAPDPTSLFTSVQSFQSKLLSWALSAHNSPPEPLLPLQCFQESRQADLGSVSRRLNRPSPQAGHPTLREPQARAWGEGLLHDKAYPGHLLLGLTATIPLSCSASSGLKKQDTAAQLSQTGRCSYLGRGSNPVHGPLSCSQEADLCSSHLKGATRSTVPGEMVQEEKTAG